MHSPLSQLPTLDELTSVFFEELFNRQSSLTKIAPVGVATGIGYGVARVAQRVLVQTAILESRYLPDQAHGEYLDYLAALRGIGARFGALGASTYVRLTAAPGTHYPAGTQVLSTTGVTFVLEASVTIPAAGFSYAPVRSQTTGERTNVGPLSLNTVAPQPAGHLAVINEYQATGGRDVEDDETLRRRVVEGPNVLARGTLAMAEQLLTLQDPRVLRLHYAGSNAAGQLVLTVATQNAAYLNATELRALAEYLTPYLSLRDQRPTGFAGAGVQLLNASYYPVDISLRCDFAGDVDIEDVRRQMQQRIGRYLDHRFWATNQRVEWEELLQIARTTPGVQYCYDQHFSPREDLVIPPGSLPRVRGFLLLNAVGAVLSGAPSVFSPVYYPQVADFALQQVLATV